MSHVKRVIALGFFDGVHLGHAALLRKVNEVAALRRAIPAALTFDRSPAAVVDATRNIPLLTTPDGRAELMERLFGIREVIVATFDRAMMEMPWESFIADFLVGRHGAVHVVAGHDFRFGHRGEGTAPRLMGKCARLGVGCDIVEKVVLDGIAVSSTHIRTLLARGDMEEVNRFLGRPYSLTGTVAHGKGLGSSLGFPTVNLAFPVGVMTPAHGVYAARVWVDGAPYAAAVNVGVRPTVETGGAINAEGFLLDFSGDLYGKMLRMEFFLRLRPERRFPSLEDLRAEVMRNAGQTRDYFAAHGL